MNKFYAILLSIALVLGFATIASAETKFAVTGEFEFNEDSTGTDFGGMWYDVAYTDLTVTNSFTDAASGSLVIRADGYNWEVYVESAEFNYKFSDMFTAGLLYAYDYDEDPYYGYKFFNADDEGFFSNVFTYSDNPLFTGAVNFEGGSVKAYVDAYDYAENIYVAGAYALDALSLKAWYASDDRGSSFIAKGAYTLSDELTLTGAYRYDFDETSDVFLKAKYATDVYAVEGKLTYDVDLEDFSGYRVKGSYFMGDVTLYGYYDKSKEFGVGTTVAFGDSELGFEYRPTYSDKYVFYVDLCF